MTPSVQGGDSLIAVGCFAELLHSHGFFLDVVLREQTGLAGHDLLNGCRD